MTESPPPRGLAELTRGTAGAYIGELQAGYREDTSASVAALAQLRRGAGKLPHEVPELWGVTGAERLYQGRDLSEREGSRAEAALFLAVTLYALHQQSRPENDMHRPGIELGTAVRRLMPNAETDDEPIRRRFVRVGASADLDVLAYRLRELVSLLRRGVVRRKNGPREPVPLDYAQLAYDLCEAQTTDGMRRVRQRWGRSFHSYRPPAAASDDAQAEDPTTEEDTA